MTEQSHDLDYQDAEGNWHIMCACGHTVTGPKPGAIISLCPNCQWLITFKSIPVVYPERVEKEHVQEWAARLQEGKGP